MMLSQASPSHLARGFSGMCRYHQAFGAIALFWADSPSGNPKPGGFANHSIRQTFLNRDF
jgi:hypothetical protein